MARLEILKTYKIYIGGQFPRTESGRFYTPLDSKGNPLANVCLSSRKDFRNAVVAARKAFGSWSERAAFNRGQIIYRIAEMLEGRRAQFEEEIIKQGKSAKEAKQEVDLSIDRLVYYTGWCDKYQQVFSAVNPVASSHFNFSVLEPTGVVAVIAPQDSSLIGLVSTIIPIITGGNTVVVLASEKLPLCAITFAEVLNSSDVPAGIINILTGQESELLSHMGSHKDVNAILYASDHKENYFKLKKLASESVKRVYRTELNFMDESAENPFLITDFQEVKTTWHPIENIGGSSSNY
ncbi:MAG: aldehyde dehydrogenase family protein [Crocinitomicaceae bacterium]|nr:aldehyde dehydrogenase family protein [Crocinitomicaceae bacterium]